MPGGGGLVAANHVFSAAPKDGTVIGLFHEAQMMNQLTGRRRRPVRPAGVQLARQLVRRPERLHRAHRCAGDHLQGHDRRSTPIAVGGTGPGSNTYDAPRVLAAATGANLKAVAGYPTTNDVRIGVERGELQGMCLGWESVQSASGQWLDDRYAVVFVQNGTTRHKDLPDVPLAMEFAKDDDSRMLLRLVDAPGAMAKPFALPPGVDRARVEVMRSALADTIAIRPSSRRRSAMRLDFQPKDAAGIQQVLNDRPRHAARHRGEVPPDHPASERCACAECTRERMPQRRRSR